MQFVAQTVGAFVGLFLGILAAVYVWMGVFVLYLGYDYVTASSILFILAVFGTALQALIVLAVPTDAQFSRGFVAFFGFLLYPLLLAYAFRLYEMWNAPQISSLTNVVELYRSVVSGPVLDLQQAVASMGPSAARAVSIVEASPLYSQIVASLVVAIIMQILRLATRRPVAAPLGLA